MSAAGVDPAELSRLQDRERDLLAQIARLEAANRELEQAARTSRNFKASVDAGHTILDLDHWGPA